MTQLEALTPLDYALQALRMNPDATFEEVKARALMEGVKLHPITFGRAKTKLGLQAPKPRVRKETPEAELRSVEKLNAQALLAEVLERVRALDQELASYRSAMSEIRSIIAEYEAV